MNGVTEEQPRCTYLLLVFYAAGTKDVLYCWACRCGVKVLLLTYIFGLCLQLQLDDPLFEYGISLYCVGPAFAVV